jgi:hypothetical protein
MMDEGGFAEIDCENNNHHNNEYVAFNDNDHVMNTKETAATPSTTTTSILATMIEAVVGDCTATWPDQVMADTCSTSEERRQDHEINISPCPAAEQRKSIFFFGSASHGGAVNTPTLTIPPSPPTGEQQFLEMEPSQDDIISISDDNNSIVMDDTEDLSQEDTMLMPEATTRPCTTAVPPLMPVSRCSSMSSPLCKSSLISPTRSSSTRSVVRTIALANEDVVVLEEPTDIRRVSFANNEAIYVKSDLPYLTEEDIARYFWGDRECLESRMQRRALVNAFKRHMRGHPMPEWTEEIDSV